MNKFSPFFYFFSIGLTINGEVEYIGLRDLLPTFSHFGTFTPELPPRVCPAVERADGEFDEVGFPSSISGLGIGRSSAQASISGSKGGDPDVADTYAQD